MTIKGFWTRINNGRLFFFLIQKTGKEMEEWIREGSSIQKEVLLV